MSARSPSVGPALPALALNREQAAAALSMGVDAFDRYVRPQVRCVYIGSTRRWAVSELQRWLDETATRWDDRRPSEERRGAAGTAPGMAHEELTS